MDEVQLVGVADWHCKRAEELAQKFDLAVEKSVDDLLARKDVDIVHIATPPSTHRDLVLRALKAGKHVLCEKPLATNTEDAKVMLAAADAADRILVVNLIMRYDPLNVAVRTILQKQLLGPPIHGFLENYGGDSRLGPDHWFWKRDQSGGIFIEHGVHFFDLFETWLGPGQVLAALQMTRPGYEDEVDQVQCFCRYEHNVMVSFYHGFHQSDSLERQEFRIVCERGEIRLFEWLPTSIRIECAMLESEAENIARHLPKGKIKVVEELTGKKRLLMNRHKEYEADAEYVIEGNCGVDKSQLYGQVLRDLLRDQIKAMNDVSHRRVLDESAGLTSLEMAETATHMLVKPDVEPAAGKIA